VIEISDRAKVELKKLLLAKVDWPGARLRLLDRGGGKLGLGIDIEAESDRVVEYEGDVLMVVEDELASRIDGIMIDVDNTDEGVELVICELV
jgi:Fe-S cluster assembly iron-binding protein IscA